MAHIKIDDEIHSFIKIKCIRERLLIEKVTDDILRPWYEEQIKKEKGDDKID